MTEVCKQLYDGVKRTPQQRAEEACAWIAKDYPKKWLRLVNLCENAKAQGWPRVRRGDIFVLAAQHGMSMSECNEFRFDNTMWSVVSRYLLMFRPGLATVIFPREAEIDDADLERAWRDTVMPNTFFPASSWQEAAQFYGGAA